MQEKIPVAKTKGIRESGFDESWLQDQIYQDPSILELGDLEVVSKEKKQPSGGRIDFLLQNPEDDSMYEVEVMLGETDESHIIRTIEYWDNEKRLRPKRQHYAVLVAETINRRFFNVISLLSFHMPLIAIQASMIEVNGQKVLHFTKVLDIYEEPEIDVLEEIHDEKYWQNKSSQTLVNAKTLKEIVDKVYGSSTLNYLKNYIAISINNKNHFSLRGRSGNDSRLRFRVDQAFVEEIKSRLDEKGFTPTIKNNEVFKLDVDKDKISHNEDLFQKIAEKVKESRE